MTPRLLLVMNFAPPPAGLLVFPARLKAGTPRLLVPALLSFLLCCLCGCASTQVRGSGEVRKFDFSKDTFSFANELVWEYSRDAQGHWTTHRREKKPEYSLHCFVVVRSAAQFFENSQFDPQQPRADEKTYRRLIRRVVATNLRKPMPASERIVIPGYPDLRSFSRDYESLLKAECGGAWQCYVQRGNWRMIFPFSRHQQARSQQRIRDRLQQGHPVLVHLVRFPQLSINHSVLVVAAETSGTSVRLVAYDPNEPDAPLTLEFDPRSNTFYMPPGAYFPGGRVDLYETCHRWNY